MAAGDVATQAPGFLGAFHFVMEESLLLWQIEEGLAEASAILLWLVWFGPITIWGLIDASREGVSLSSFKEDLGPTEEDDDHNDEGDSDASVEAAS